jgi:3-vinyl bacteriochlorophyllide hydratase
MLVIALHSAYLVVWWKGIGTLQLHMVVALAAYAVYLVNALQFLVKLRTARLQRHTSQAPAAGPWVHERA